jgi:hypothetical protein
VTNRTQRPIDAAMSLDRADKQTIRQWWADSVRQRSAVADNHDVPWFLTLPGELGRDIQLLIDDGLIKLTEAGAIDNRDNRKIVAVESNMPACGQLKARFPGLQVREMNVKNMLAGDASHSFPDKETKKLCRAAVVNLDYNGPWLAKDDALVAVDKFVRLHEGSADWTAVDWTLCLTFRAVLSGDMEDRLGQVKFLKDQITDSESLSNWVSDQIGLQVNRLDEVPESIGSWTDDIVQRFLCILIPLKLVHLGCARGWAVNCVRSCLYGGSLNDVEGPTAAMVTFIVDFAQDEAIRQAPTEGARRCRSQITPALCQIDASGSIEHIARPGV